MKSEKETHNAIKLEEAWGDIPPDERLEIVKCLFLCITQTPHGSFRRLIYDRLGFKGDAYETLYKAGGMHITNALCDYECENG